MATPYLLAAALTLLVVLVKGQDSLHAQELQVKAKKLTEVAEVIIEDELNFDIDFSLLGSANTRAECIQGKKCIVNKGGTCQRKGNACPGKIRKGCSKGCSCCVPDKITCKPSRRCKRANGSCIARKECKGKIVSKGCKKPNSCKRTHVCCVQDESTTEPSVCRGPRCPTTDVCPDIAQFPANYYVCKRDDVDGTNCITKTDAKNFMNRVPAKPADNPYILFASKTFDGKDISYISTGADTCKIKDEIQIWSCTRDSPTSNWSCDEKGFCTADIKMVGGVYKPDGNSLQCPCPNPRLKQKHICSDCRTKEQALTFTIKGRPDDRGPNTVLAGQPTIIYKKIETNPDDILCKITSPESVTAWQVTKHNGTWDESEDLGECNNLESALKNGHLFYQQIKCYKEHSDKRWGDDCTTLLTIETNDAPSYCMKNCTEEADCNAFNYKFGDFCVLMTCDIANSDLVPDTDYDAFYLFRGATATESDIVEE